ncbi:MAG: hypothetical protein OXI57_12090 [Rhodospirillales bacterium]|nr:hypothetical protein [Rhodospirillales bacterium]
MQIQDVTLEIEQSLANLKSLKASALPPALQGLRRLPLGDYEPRVSIRYWNGNQYRKVRRTADASYFDPDRCDVVIEFVPSDSADDGDGWTDAGGDTGDTARASALDGETAMDQLLKALSEMERARELVSLKWFRDQYLPACGYDWARDPRACGTLLLQATGQRLILTSQVPNPNNPLDPVTAIRINRRHPRFETNSQSRRSQFEPVRIRGGAIADTVIGDRR